MMRPSKEPNNAMSKPPPSPETSNAAAPGNVERELCQTAVSAARKTIASRVAEDGVRDTQSLLHLLSDTVDALLVQLFGDTGDGRVSVVALGGYGRRELFPYSDVDVLFVHQGMAPGEIDELVSRVIYPLWDAGLAVGHMVRSIDETLDLADKDLTLATSLLDARLVAGEEGPLHALQAGAYREIFGADQLNNFQRLLVEERRRRHKKFGETVFLLEPNIKNGAGGLRDVDSALWAAKARYGIERLEQLADVDAATRRQKSALLEARDFLRSLRLAMHLHADRAQDRLLFELQEALAPTLYPQDEIPGVRKRAARAVAPAVERLMQELYRSARTVVIESEGILQRCFWPASGVEPRHLEAGFAVAEGNLVNADPESFWKEPCMIVRAYELAHEHDLRLSRSLQDVLSEAVASEPGAQLMADSKAIEIWRRLFSDPEREGEASLLERMHEQGVLAAIVPEFEPCTGRVQHDIYHVYTVDRHTLYVVDLLKAWRRGERTEIGVDSASVMAELEDVETLYLAALLHDVAKPLGARHAQKGGRIAAGVAARLGLAPKAVADVVFLVSHHLSVPHVSQRRDLNDPRVISDFATLVDDEARLRMLYLLAMADTAMTAPGNLSAWKASLMNELYRKALARMRDADTQHLTGERRRLALMDGARERWGARGAAMVERLPDALLSAQSIDGLMHHLSVALDLESAPDSLVRVASMPIEHEDTTMLTICCADAPGVLATMTGAFLLHRVPVLAAQVYTLSASGRQKQQALDIFWVRRADDPELWRSYARTLQQALSGEQPIDPLVADHFKPTSLPPRVMPGVERRVTIDNKASDRATIIELQLEDKPGVLYQITRALSGLQLEVTVARVSTQASKVIDSFYVVDRLTGAKLWDKRRVATIRSVLESTIGA
jgi:[protein-PII] uridylyltransferase